MGDYQRTSSETDHSSTQRVRAPNFSRPRPQTPRTLDTANERRKPYTPPSTVRSISAFYHSADHHLPSEPRFSSDSSRGDPASSSDAPSASSASDVPSQTDLRIRPGRKSQFDSQRYTPAFKRRPSAGSTTSTQTFNLNLTAKQSPAPSPPNTVPPPQPSASRPTPTSNPSTIAKRISVDQYSERAASTTTTTNTTQQHAEDTASHHTVSSSASGRSDELGRWTSSENGDVSSLSEAQIKKLQKKGINPALYVEMKGARKGRRWVGPLVGNTFLG